MQNFSTLEMQSNVWVSGPRPPFEWQGTQAAPRGVWPTSIPVLVSVHLSASALPALIPSCSTGGVDTELFPQDRCVLMQTASSAFSHDAAEQRPSLPGERAKPRHNSGSPFLFFWVFFKLLKRITTAPETNTSIYIINRGFSSTSLSNLLEKVYYVTVFFFLFCYLTVITKVQAASRLFFLKMAMYVKVTMRQRITFCKG